MLFPEEHTQVQSEFFDAAAMAAGRISGDEFPFCVLVTNAIVSLAMRNVDRFSCDFVLRDSSSSPMECRPEAASDDEVVRVRELEEEYKGGGCK